MAKKYDFSGWATMNDLKCSDGRTIMRDAFKDQDGTQVPLVWNHQHNDSFNVLGHTDLENRSKGVYAYGYFNDTESGQNAKMLVEHGDVVALSIFANHLKQGRNGEVYHGEIKEVSLVLAGANPGAYIESVLSHGDSLNEDEAIIYMVSNESNILEHSKKSKKEEPEDEEDTDEDNTKDEGDDVGKADEKDDQETLRDVLDTLTEKQKKVVYAIIGQVMDDKDDEDEDEDEEEPEEPEDEEEDEEDLDEPEKNVNKGRKRFMKHNVFDVDTYEGQDVISHADQAEILKNARSNNVGSFRTALNMYLEDNDTLSHGISDNDIVSLLPDYEDLMPGAPEAIPEDVTWVDVVMNKVHKTPFSRIRTRQADITGLRALGYKTKGTQKSNMGNISLVTRSTDPQTVYVKDKLNRDDIIDITDFDVVAYQYGLMRKALHEELASAILFGDGRDLSDEAKIMHDRIRPIWLDDELYTIHRVIDRDAVITELQGTNTAANFGDSFITAEAIISAALYAREGYKGGSVLDFFCTPHLLNVMLLAKDMNGRRIYNSRRDLADALNVREIYEVDKMENKIRTATVGNTTENRKLLGLFVNLSNYSLGSVKKGEIAQFNQFDIDFNQEKFLIETRVSGAITRVKCAIALEEVVEEAATETDPPSV